VVNFYDCFVKAGYQVPKINGEEMRKFRKERDDTHYRVLSETNVGKTSDLGLYFERLLFASRIVGESIGHVGAIQRDRRGYTGRYGRLVATYPSLFRDYSSE